TTLVIASAWGALAQQVTGSGTLSASGSGTATITLNGSLTVSGQGTLGYRDLAHDASVHLSGNGTRTVRPDGTVELPGFNGQASIAGTSFVAILSGANISL